MAKQLSKSIRTKTTRPKIRFRDGTGKFQPLPGTPIPENLKPNPPEEPKPGQQEPLPEDRPPEWPPTP
jgi:hypothetical protein